MSKERRFKVRNFRRKIQIPRAMGVSKRSKTDKLKAIKVGNTDLGSLLDAVMKVEPPKGKKKAARRRAKK